MAGNEMAGNLTLAKLFWARKDSFLVKIYFLSDTSLWAASKSTKNYISNQTYLEEFEVVVAKMELFSISSYEAPQGAV